MGVSCYLCGRDFGTASFGIHLTTCRERWSKDQGDPSVKQPSPPPGIEQALSGTLKGRQLIEFNRQSVALWKALVLKPCSFCSRTFFPNQLAKHQAACNNNMIKKYNINDILLNIYINNNITTRQHARPTDLWETLIEALAELPNWRRESRTLQKGREQPTEICQSQNLERKVARGTKCMGYKTRWRNSSKL